MPGQTLESKSPFSPLIRVTSILSAGIISSLSIARVGAAGVYDPQHGFVITGGYNADLRDSLSSAERTYDGVNFSPFPEMPEKLSTHCLVSLKNGNLFVTGASSQIHRDLTFMFYASNNTWSDKTMVISNYGSKSGI